MNVNGIFSHDSDEWTTPLDLFHNLDQFYNFTLDPCSTDENALCDIHFTLKENGLIQSWKDHRVFCNPPYSKIKDWIIKCDYECKYNNALIICLVPARTDTRWFHDYVYHKYEIQFLRGRLKFSDSKHCAPFPSMLIYFIGDYNG